MSTIETSQDAANTASALRAVNERSRRPFLGRTRKVAGTISRLLPAMLWMLIFYMIIEWSVPDMRQVFFSLVFIELTPLHLIMGAGMLAIMFDLYMLVARQSANKSRAVNSIILSAMIYAGLCLAGVVLLAATGNLNWMKIFAKGEFVILTAAAIVQWPIAVKTIEILSKRLVDMANSDITQHDHGN